MGETHSHPTMGDDGGKRSFSSPPWASTHGSTAPSPEFTHDDVENDPKHVSLSTAAKDPSLPDPPPTSSSPVGTSTSEEQANLGVRGPIDRVYNISRKQLAEQQEKARTKVQRKSEPLQPGDEPSSSSSPSPATAKPRHRSPSFKLRQVARSHDADADSSDDESTSSSSSSRSSKAGKAWQPIPTAVAQALATPSPPTQGRRLARQPSATYSPTLTPYPSLFDRIATSEQWEPISFQPLYSASSMSPKHKPEASGSFIGSPAEHSGSTATMSSSSSSSATSASVTPSRLPEEPHITHLTHPWHRHAKEGSKNVDGPAWKRNPMIQEKMERWAPGMSGTAASATAHPKTSMATGATGSSPKLASRRMAMSKTSSHSDTSSIQPGADKSHDQPAQPASLFDSAERFASAVHW